MTDVKILNSILKSQNILHVGVNSSFTKTYKKITKRKKLDFVFVAKPVKSQMFAVLCAKLMGKKFLWIQSFSNPPIPGFFTKLLLNQTDTILVSSKKTASKLHGFGIDKPKIRVRKP